MMCFGAGKCVSLFSMVRFCFFVMKPGRISLGDLVKFVRLLVFWYVEYFSRVNWCADASFIMLIVLYLFLVDKSHNFWIVVYLDCCLVMFALRHFHKQWYLITLV